MILGVHHPALAVPDIQKALDFYCGVLGFKEVMTAELPSGIPPINSAFGVPDAGCKVRMIRKGNSCVELFEFKNAQPRENNFEYWKTGIFHFCVKDPDVEELRSRLQELKRQRSRVRDALEEAMCRGDRFGSAELRTLLEHPILAPALSRLVFVGDGVAGYLVEGGRALRDHAGAQHVLGHQEEVRVAHPHDLLARGDWSAWQRECFLAERIQPFKQLFRELYPLTDTERGTQRSRRYAGHQVNPRQALALLGGRGWVARPEEGVSRTFHEEGLTARLGFQESFHTPADVEGLTLEEVIFTRKGEWKELPLAEIPARLLSEALRDLDLVVSVAHRGGVDPEATASTVEMRAALVQETCELLGLDNVELQQHHALIRGALGEYSVHLGSAGVMLLPGTAIPIVAVHSQHQGRLFLPFADDDPKTAEVLSKVLLLARDREIRDPSVLEWIRAGRGGGVG